jgi:nitrate/nitrite transport system permease protein
MTTGPNDKGIGIQLGHSLGRVGLGFLLACAGGHSAGLLPSA